MNDEASALEPLRHAVTVGLGADDAWQLFTEGMDRWWPLDEHAMFEGGGRRIQVEPRDGGEIRELTPDGKSARWARILAWEPPRRLLLAWKPNTEPRPETELEVRFTPQADGATLVELEHRGWERLGDLAVEARESYGTGWVFVLGGYQSAAATSAAAAG